jgi:uncharacterized protein with gpF-like domain
MTGHRARLHRILSAAMRSAGLAAANRLRAVHRKGSSSSEYEEKRGASPTEAEIEADILAAIDIRVAKAVEETWKLTTTRIKNSLKRGAVANEGYIDVAIRLRNEVGKMTAWMAESIARTEIGVAEMTAEHTEMLATEETLGITIYKIWTSAGDDRVRESHAEADGDEARMDKPFTVGGAEMLHPMDTNGPPEEWINCRCVLKYDYRRQEA